MGFIEDYFINPILQNGWFNPVNTLVYSLILVAAVFLVFKLLLTMKIQINRYFFFALLPFIFWGSSTRVLHDAAVAGALSPELTAFYSSPLFPTPGSYIITFSLAVSVLFLSLLIMKFSKIQYWKIMAVVGLILDLINIVLIPWKNITPLLLIGGLTLLCCGIVFGLSRIVRKPFERKNLPFPLSLQNQAILSAHFLDASATFVSLTFYGYFEQHVLPRFVFDLFGPASFFLLKALVVIPVLFLLDRYADDQNFKNFLKIVIFILGAAPGLRDLLRLLAGV